MMKARSVFCAAMILGFAGCADQVTGPRAAVPGAPKAVKLHNAHVWDYGAIPNDGQDDAAAFQAAVNAAQVVFVPAGTYDFRTTVLLPSDTYIYGNATATVLRAVGPYWTAPDPRFGERRPAIFFAFTEANNGPGSSVGVAVAHMAFTGEPGNIAFALDGRHTVDLVFRDNWVTDLGMVTLDQDVNTQILRNRAVGSSYRPEYAVLMNFSRGALVQHDTISGYYNGIEWWGGAADPAKEGFTRTKGTGQLTIDGNRVTDVDSGIWGGNGEYIRVTNNTVEGCADVCLDAEGSDSVSFVGNTARFAGAGVLASYFFSSRILFDNNTVEQNGTPYGGLPGASVQPHEAWTRMFWLANESEDTDVISVELRNNRFVFNNKGATSLVGLMNKGSSQSFAVHTNVLTNTVMDFEHNNNGHVSVTNNQISFSYNAQRPAIYVGSNHFPYGASAGSATVSGNTIRSSASQSGAGISLWQWASGLTINNYVESNRICGFSNSIRYRNDGAAHYYRIANNRYTGSVTNSNLSTVTPNVSTSANTTVSYSNC